MPENITAQCLLSNGDCPVACPLNEIALARTRELGEHEVVTHSRKTVLLGQLKELDRTTALANCNMEIARHQRPPHKF